MPPHLSVVIGASGSGKTTWRTRNQGKIQQPFHDVDAMAAELGDPDDPDIRAQAKEAYDGLIENHLKMREPFGFETVYSSRTRVEIIERARELGYHIVAFFLCTDKPAINIARVKQRSEEGGHSVPGEEVIRHWQSASRNLVATWSLFDRIEFYNTSEIPPRLVATKDGDRYALVGLPSPEWLAPITRHGMRPGTGIRSRSPARNRP